MTNLDEAAKDIENFVKGSLRKNISDLEHNLSGLNKKSAQTLV
jgi:hypothetical protein